MSDEGMKPTDADMAAAWRHVESLAPPWDGQGVWEAYLAGVTAERERCATLAEARATRNRDQCPPGCRCADGFHIAMAIRRGPA